MSIVVLHQNIYKTYFDFCKMWINEEAHAISIIFCCCSILLLSAFLLVNVKNYIFYKNNCIYFCSQPDLQIFICTLLLYKIGFLFIFTKHVIAVYFSEYLFTVVQQNRLYIICLCNDIFAFYLHVSYLFTCSNNWRFSISMNVIIIGKNLYVFNFNANRRYCLRLINNLFFYSDAPNEDKNYSTWCGTQILWGSNIFCNFY